MSKKILIGSMNGTIYIYDTVMKTLVQYDKPDTEGIMGLALSEKHLFLSSREMIMRQEYPRINNEGTRYGKYEVSSPQFHQLLLHNKKIYITCTAINEIWVFEYDILAPRRKLIKPPNPKNPVGYKVNYNHVNSICYHNGLFYVGLNWFTSKQYGKSGICVLDQNLKEQNRFEYGWETHGFTFIDDKQYALCASSNPSDKNVNHPLLAGLMVDGELVFEHPINVFCKAFVVGKNHIYLLGGDSTARNKRGDSCGVIYILDRKFNLLNTLRFDGTGQFCGGILL